MQTSAGSAASARTSSPAAELRAAVEHHGKGRLDKAEELYRRALRRHPDHPDILHLLGVLAFDRGRPERALQLIG
ncbi:MAG: tetratricopeptide repeat protein, partial [Acetobacteraceae bacterium]|nr:tetratricopeptide repeat protein [Acetobacteraceae bacterium]